MTEYRFKNHALRKTTKTHAETQYNRGFQIALYPSKANPESPWAHPFIFSKRDGIPFETQVNNFRYYCCNNKELGTGVAYYLYFPYVQY